MMVVKFQQTYADQRYGYKSGQIATLPDAQARSLIDSGIANNIYDDVLDMMEGLHLKGFIVNSNTPADFAQLAKSKGYTIHSARKS